MIEEFTKLIPETLKNKSGAVFYSGRNAFQGNKDLYILGLNPGGSEIEQEADTIFGHTDRVLTEKGPNWSEYKDEIWKGVKQGDSPLQLRVCHLLDILKLSPYEVPSSNLCFVRSSNEEKISRKLSEYMELCWPFHEKVIDELKVKVILCFGKTAGNFVKFKIHANNHVDDFVENNDRKWRTDIFKNSDGQIVILATHPSRADWKNPQSDPSAKIKEHWNL